MMNENHFARLFAVDEYQVLLTIEEDEENDGREIVVSRTEIDGVTISVKMGGEGVDARGFLASFTQEKAAMTVESAKSLCGRLRSHA